jgi:hypothetical protein
MEREVEYKHLFLLERAEKNLRNADHLAYITFGVVKESRLLVKILEQVYSVVVDVINSILQYEYLRKQIKLSSNPVENFNKFKNFCAPIYGISVEQTNKVVELFSIMKNHKDSSMEFIRDDRLMIMSNSLKTQPLNIDKVKNYIFLAKELMKSARERIM